MVLHLGALVVPDLLVIVLEAENREGLLRLAELPGRGRGGEVGEDDHGDKGEANCTDTR